MKIRNDFVTNSSSSSYILATKMDFDDFLNQQLPNVINDIYKYQLNILRDILKRDNVQMPQDEAKQKLFEYYKYRNLPFDPDKPFEELYAEAEEKAKELIKQHFNVSDDYKLFDLGPFDDHSGPLNEALDQREVFLNEDEIKEDIKLFYMNNH